MNRRYFTEGTLYNPPVILGDYLTLYIWENLEGPTDPTNMVLEMFQYLNLETNTVRQDTLIVREKWGR